MNILIVEDKQEARYLMEILLKNKGYHTRVAENGKEALEKLETEKIDLIISDILMPEMDGFKFCQLVKRDENMRHIPFIFYTATYVDRKDEEFALKLGADLFLRKPMEPDKLLAEIEKMISRIEQGIYDPLDIKLKREEDVYKLYNERLIKKLEDKIDQLEEENLKRQQAELQLQKMVAEKEILLKELYHRTKNNMQVIMSMLRLYSHKILNKEWIDIVKNVNLKIRTMALVHQKLYESNDLSHVSLKDYFESLIMLLKRSYLPPKSNFQIITDFADIKVLLDTAIPLGFVLNELTTNAMKHAFPDTEDGNIGITLFIDEKESIVLQVEDNGVGLPQDFDLDYNNNLGLFMVTDIVSSQLQAKISYENSNGLKWTIVVDHECYNKRV